MIDMQQLEAGFDYVADCWPDARPRYAVTLGSGWSAVVESLPVLDTLDYGEIPGLGATGVDGHAGRIVRVDAAAGELLIFQGRRHLYEGVGWTPIALPIYLARRMGVEVCLLTNAAGGIGEGMHAGDLMLIDDHINMLGDNPLVGPHEPFWGPRFPDQSTVYDQEFGARLLAAAAASAARMHRGVYLATKGPTFETPAEIRAYRAMGADAVGMSTVPEAILANACGMRVAGLSLISNLAAGISPTALSHREVAEAAARVMPTLCRLFAALFGRES
jgi:purine-nucleoside phosphorylase